VSFDLEPEIERFGDELRILPAAKPTCGEQEQADWPLLTSIPLVSNITEWFPQKGNANLLQFMSWSILAEYQISLDKKHPRQPVTIRKQYRQSASDWACQLPSQP
jgi:hypothetical protein